MINTPKHSRKVIVVQNVIPNYRKDFFNKIMSERELIKLYSSKENELGIKSVDINYEYYSDLKLKSLGKYIIWQECSAYLSTIRKGDVLVLSGNPRIISNYIAIAIAKFKGAKTVCWSHGWTAGSHGLLAKLRIKLMSLYDAVLLYTEKEAHKFEIDGLFSGGIYYLNNGLDYEKIKSARDKTHVKKDHEKTTLIFCGRLTEKSNIEMLIQAFELLDDSFRLFIVGDGVLFSKCTSMVKERKLTNITLVGAIDDEEKLAQYFNLADAFVYPGKVGLSLIHAFGYMLPAIIHDNDINQMPEFAASNNDNTIYFSENCITSLISAINSFGQLTLAERSRMSDMACNEARLKFNIEKMKENFFTMVDSV